MKWMRQQSRYENMAYAALWGLLFAAPVLSLYVRTATNSMQAFDWHEVLMVWKLLAVYLVLFLLHNFLLAPLLVWRQRRVAYFVLTACVVAVFMTYQCSSHPDERWRGGHPPMEMGQHDGPHPKDGGQYDGSHPKDRGQYDRPQPKEDGHRPPEFGKRPPVFLGQHDVVALVILMLMFGANLGIKGYFKSRSDQKRLVALEKENLEQQLEYLKYQINPHFFMNTLNNIHALVDIDPELAKSTILELSKMMRFVLYEGDKKGVPLSREFDFIRHYVTLMKLRYTDKVKISVDLPIEVPDRQLPPLMLITFIENAFKHGISYQHDSFIDVKVRIEGQKLWFTCRNSKAEKPNQEKGGVGLENVKQRLRLLYDENFTLNIQDEPDVYNVELTIPLL